MVADRLLMAVKPAGQGDGAPGEIANARPSGSQPSIRNLTICFY
jgi:hypothetical protein